MRCLEILSKLCGQSAGQDGASVLKKRLIGQEKFQEGGKSRYQILTADKHPLALNIYEM